MAKQVVQQSDALFRTVCSQWNEIHSL